MASTTTSVDISFDPDFWVDVEVPANVIRDNWSEGPSDQFRAAMKRQTIVRKELEPYWRQFNPEDEDLPGRKDALLTAIGGHNIEWSYNLYCIHQFGQNKASEFINHYFQQTEREAQKCGLGNLHDDFSSNSRRFGKLVMIDILNRDSFRDILTLDFCKGKMPDVNAKSENILSDPIDELEIGTVLDQLGADSREYDQWHSFEYKSDQYIVIKRHIRDRVERQVEENQDIAEADLVVLRFSDNQLRVFAPTADIANRARTGVNAAVRDEDKDEEEQIDFEPEGETAPSDHFDDLESRIAEIQGRDDDEAALIEIGVNQSPLAGSPKVDIKGEGDILPALNQLQQANLDLLANPDNVRYLKIRYNERPYQIFLNRPEQDGEKRWALRYSSGTPSEEEQEAFEGFVNEILGLKPTYRHS